MNIYVVDIEGDSLTPTLIHVVSYQRMGTKEVKSLLSYNIMRKFFTQDDAIFIMHNGIRWDKPNIQRLLGIKIKAFIIDSLFVSWYIFPSRLQHGLEGYGESYGIPKPKIDDWQNLPIGVYIKRCEEDVKINMRLWKEQLKALSTLYDCREEDVYRLPIIEYLMFKADCAAEQERSRWRVDDKLCRDTLEALYEAREAKVEGLARVMPKVPKKALRKPPEKPYKKDGTLSVAGAKWQALLKRENLPEGHKAPVEEIVSYADPNPKSTPQVKDWLYSLGWEPITFKYEREDDGSERMIPQVRRGEDGVKVLCPSVLDLIEQEPDIELLDGLTVINHRISILEGFLDNMDSEGFISAQIQGLTNTLRFKHKVAVNLPGVDKAYGKEIRGALIARDGYELMGSDMNSLEEMTKRHYIYLYDPDYVEEMSHPDFDAHLDLAVQQGLIKREDMADHVHGRANHSKIRKPFKVVNYSAVYGVGKPKLAREMKVSEKEAKKLLDAYWKRNWSVRKIAEDAKVKTIRGQMWLFNPVSKFWYSLRYDKDRFSTLNQGTGVFCFDTWVSYVTAKRKQMTAQFHDEGVWEIKKGFREKGEELLRWAIDKTNEQLKLNIKLDIDVQFGDSYGQIH